MPEQQRTADGITCDSAGRCIPGCYNPTAGCTACICGHTWWPGRVGTWHTGHDGEVYFLHASDCADRQTTPGYDHLCADIAGIGAETFWARTEGKGV